MRHLVVGARLPALRHRQRRADGVGGAGGAGASARAVGVRGGVPQVLAAALDGRAVAEAHAVGRLHALREDAEDARRLPVGAHDAVARAKGAHRAPAVGREHGCVERLRLPHRGPRGDDDEVRVLPAARLLVQLAEAARHARDAALASVDRLKLLQRVLHHLIQGRGGAAQLRVRDLKDPALGLVKELEGVRARVVGLASPGPSSSRSSCAGATSPR